MSDLIDRQAAIDAIMELVRFDTVEELRDHCKQRTCMYWSDGVLDAIDAISVMPSAQSERKKEWWTKACDVDDGRVKCTGCFKTYDWTSQAQYYNYCPNCGADMRGEQDDLQ